MRLLAVLCALVMCVRVAAADPDPKRKVVVLEYRAGSSALGGIAARLVAAIGKQTSLAVLGPDQTRAVYGDHLEQAISKCGGEAECIAKIGARAGAAEVILVGVSELGDVILTMQRIDVAGHKVDARVADSIAAGSTPTDDQLGYYLARLLPPTDFLRFGMLDIVANQADAAVTIGGEKKGTAPIKGLRLHAPATYVIKVEKPGFQPFTTTVQLPPDGALKVEADLTRPGSGPAWYQKWYVLTAAGILVAGMAGGTIYFATRTTPDRVPVTITTN